jgi:hypothetical protein
VRRLDNLALRVLPPRVGTLLDLQERIRAHAMYPEAFDPKTAQLMLFGLLPMDPDDATQLHAIAEAGAEAGAGRRA